MKTGYYAITTTGCGWHILSGPHESVDEAEDEGRACIGMTPGDYVTELYRVSEQENLKIVPAARLHSYGIDVREWREEQLNERSV